MLRKHAQHHLPSRAYPRLFLIRDMAVCPRVRINAILAINIILQCSSCALRQYCWDDFVAAFPICLQAAMFASALGMGVGRSGGAAALASRNAPSIPKTFRLVS